MPSYRIWLIILISSYFYCLPFGRFSILGFTTDIRIYDFTILLFWFFNWQGLKSGLGYLIRNKRWATYYVYIIIGIILFSIVFNIFYRGTEYIGPTMIRAYRFVGYWMTLHAVLISIRNYSDYKLIRNVFYSLITLMAVIAFLQAIGILPHFWPEYWREMYKVSSAPVATLSPHHLQISMVMLMGLCLTLAYWQTTKNLLFRTGLTVVAFIMILIPIFAGTRTYFLALPGVLLGILIFQRFKLVSSLVAIVLGFIGFTLLADSNIQNQTSEIAMGQFQERFLKEYEKGGVKELASERTVVYESIFFAIRKHPSLLITGTGFQAAAVFIYGTGAHNNFLQFLIETGVIGLSFFLLFLWTSLRNLYESNRLFRKRSIGVFSGYIFAGFIGLILTMLTSETMYAQAASFTLPGQIMIFIGIGIAPYFRKHLYEQKHSKRK